MTNNTEMTDRRSLALQRLNRRRMILAATGTATALASGTTWARGPLETRCVRTFWFLGETTVHELFGEPGPKAGKPFKQILLEGWAREPDPNNPETVLTDEQKALVKQLADALSDDFYFRYFYVQNRGDWPLIQGHSATDIVDLVAQLKAHFVQPHWLYCKEAVLEPRIRTSCHDLLDGWQGVDDAGNSRQIVGVIHQFGDLSVRDVFELRHKGTGALWKNEALIPMMKRMRIPWVDDAIDWACVYPANEGSVESENSVRATEKGHCTAFDGSKYFCSESFNKTCITVGDTDEPASGTDYCGP